MGLEKKKMIRTDPMGFVVYSLQYLYNETRTLLYSLLNRSRAYLCGIKLGKGCIFYGSAVFSRFPGSKINVGKNCEFASKSYINYRGISHPCILQTGNESASICIGDNCGLSGCSIVADSKVVIGNNVLVGADSIIGDRDDHPDVYSSEPNPVVIDDNVWIGMHCIVLKGVHIGMNSIIGAGSVVTKDVPAGVIAAGVPCQIIKSR